MRQREEGGVFIQAGLDRFGRAMNVVGGGDHVDAVPVHHYLLLGW